MLKTLTIKKFLVGSDEATVRAMLKEGKIPKQNGAYVFAGAEIKAAYPQYATEAGYPDFILNMPMREIQNHLDIREDFLRYSEMLDSEKKYYTIEVDIPENAPVTLVQSQTMNKLGEFNTRLVIEGMRFITTSIQEHDKYVPQNKASVPEDLEELNKALAANFKVILGR